MFELHLNSTIFYKWLRNCSKMRNNKSFRNNDTVTNDRQSNKYYLHRDIQMLLAETTVYCSETAYASLSQFFRKNEASKKQELTIPKAIHLFRKNEASKKRELTIPKAIHLFLGRTKLRRSES